MMLSEMCPLEPMIPNSRAEEPRSEMEQLTKDSEESWGLKEAAKAVCKARKVAVMYTLLAACVSDPGELESETEADSSGIVKAGYDARQRVALRLLALWLGIEWVKVTAMELMVAYMAMAAQKEMEQNGQETNGAEKKSRWKKWKRGGIIGAAAVTGGALLFVTGGSY